MEFLRKERRLVLYSILWRAQSVSSGFYGHWLGVNWVWVAGIVPVHMIFSISLPILLVGLA